jgi:hypothetical protein
MMLSQAFTRAPCPPSSLSPHHGQADEHGCPHHSRILGVPFCWKEQNGQLRCDDDLNCCKEQVMTKK